PGRPVPHRRATPFRSCDSPGGCNGDLLRERAQLRSTRAAVRPAAERFLYAAHALLRASLAATERCHDLGLAHAEALAHRPAGGREGPRGARRCRQQETPDLGDGPPLHQPFAQPLAAANSIHATGETDSREPVIVDAHAPRLPEAR